MKSALTANRKSLPGASAPVPDWDPSSKEPWFVDFEKEPVNDEKWSCLVTSAVQNEEEDEEIIEIYTQCVNTGLRKAVKIISMTDVIKLLKGTNGGNSTKKGGKTSKSEKPTEGTPIKAPAAPFSQVVALAAKHATFTPTECRLPPDLMAAVLKYMILTLKDENRLQKRADAVMERKTREENLKAKFIRDLKPYEPGQVLKSGGKVPPNILELEEPINDEPVAGPDLYILLTGFYNASYFSQLQAINVPFPAVLKISRERETEKPLASSESDAETGAFWKNLMEECDSSERFKDIAVVEYRAPPKNQDAIRNYKVVFDELTWTQYSVYCIYRQHQKYLQELHVQRLILSLEPLDLSKCEVYNKLCDALVTGEPLTPLLVLYAIVEQVVVGVPETQSVALEHRPNPAEFFGSSTTLSEEKPVPIVTPCKKCRNKKFECFVEKAKQVESTSGSSEEEEEEEEWIEISGENTEKSVSLRPQTGGNSTPNSSGTASTALKTFETVISKVLSERKTEKELRDDRRWKTPILCFYGDSVLLQAYHCDSRLFDSRTVVDRFFRNSALPLIWKNYPELPLAERAVCDFHYHSLWKLSEQREDVLRINLSFILLMNLIGKTNPREVHSERSEPDVGKGKLNARSSQNLFALMKEGNSDFPSYFLTTFILGVKRDNVEEILQPTGEKDSAFRCSGTPVLQTTRSSRNRSSKPPVCLSQHEIATPQSPSDDEKALRTFYSILNCCQISSLLELRFQNDKLIQGFKFYENLEPDLMIQRLLEAKENFNAVQSRYISPTDNLVVVMYDEYDERGIFQATQSGVVATSVCLRDFYRHIYPDIGDWLVEEVAGHAKFTSELTEKAKEKQEKEDAEYLALLRRRYCEMSEQKRKDFLYGADPSEPDVRQKEPGDLPVKPKPGPPNRVSFVGTSFADVRVENRAKIHEFHSRDGTEVRSVVDCWLHAPSELLKVRIRRSNFLLYYNQWLGRTETNPNFTFKTVSDIIFSFYKDTAVDSNYTVSISWPTGLLIRPILHSSGIYVRQNYLKPYRRGWEIEEENCRCFLKNGQVVILKTKGDYDVLCGSGTKYAFYDSATPPRYEIISTTGEVWQFRTKGPHKKKKTLTTVNKILLGVDPNKKEAFYKREDGTYCMLWPDGRLVTNYPDGTKITTTPYFDEEEVTVDWTEEEKTYFEELESKCILEQESRSRTILRNGCSSSKTSRKNSTATGFVSVSCAYLMEHPKYSRVTFNPRDPYVRMEMPEQLSLLAYPDGSYEVRHDRNFLTVSGSTVEFYMKCRDCEDKSTVKLYLDSSAILCKCVDFFRKGFFVHRDGGTNFQEYYEETDDEDAAEGEKVNAGKCPGSHVKHPFLKQRCFAFQRDLSGVEFIHEGCLGCYFYHLPEETYYDLSTDDDPDSISHTFNSPYHKVGYEKWVMAYEDDSNSQPTNLKRKDLKEIGVKQARGNLFKYPFPKHHNSGIQQHINKGRRKVREPKVIISRTVRCLSQDPNSVIVELRKCAAAYQEKAVGIFNAYRNHSVVNDRSYDSRYVEMRLRKIALTLSQSLHSYPHLCTKFPSTDKDIHYFGHFINSMEGMNAEHPDNSRVLPNCKQIPNRLPRSSDFSCIQEENEENESPRNA